MKTTIERVAAVKMMGMRVTLLGPHLTVGDVAPDSEMLTPELEEINPLALNDHVVMLFSGPSIDADVCNAMTKRIDREAVTLPADIDVYMVTVDLPFGQKRWQQSYPLERLKLLSDYRTHSFGLNYGVLIKEYNFLARSVFVIDRDRNLCHIDLVADVYDQPNYMHAFAAARKAAV